MYLCVFILLTNKSKDIYQKAFRLLKTESEKKGIKLEPKTVMSDFDLAAINGVREVFPGALTQGFHFIQCLWRNIQEKGLSSDYNSKEESRKWFDQIKSLAFFPPSYVHFASLKQDDIIRLKPRVWLNENIINYFFNLLIEKS
ncbi:unnamed protein product [Brachionus calyciflorus]|uniref:MULE transposase domain-containing protein n=1 Tax=Brachionus calyciflorus TaxID=104777 RepID=A0A814R9R3_9BILA|nr:unnamed protein product [Brachionus calyciflorus]